MLKKEFSILVVMLVFQVIYTNAQEVYQHVTTGNIYEYLDELANNKIIGKKSAK